MDRMTKSYLSEFLTLQEIQSESDSKDFEKFCNYCLISKEYNANFRIEDISTGDAQGIDGIGIIVNGKLVDSVDEVRDLIDINKYLEVVFVFAQAKTSSSFKGSEIGNFIFSVKDTLAEKPTLPLNEEMKKFHNIIQFILDNFPKMTRGNPVCKLYYVTTGVWNGEQSLNAVIDNGISELISLSLFSDIIFEPCDGNQIRSYYMKTKESVSATFIFKDKVTLPDISGINESYFGIIPFEEFLKIIIDENSKIKNIFYDNIRDYLGENPVNDKINSTLVQKQFDFFCALNNGVTIVADSLNQSGNKFTISNYQIVNGCQTTHVLYNNKNLEGMELLYVLLRLIVTDKDDIKNQITIATNSQTAIKPEQLEALSEFQKNLEHYYKTFEGDGKLYYERRTNQYNSDDSVIKSRVISIPIQIKAFAAMFLGVPYQVSRYYGTIASRVGEQIFINNHSYSPYYTSAFSLYKLDNFFKNGLLDSKYKKAKYHILMLFRLLCNSEELPNFSSNKIERYCKKINDILNNNDTALAAFKRAIEIVDRSGIDVNNPDSFKQKEKVDLLMSTMKNL